MYTALYHLFMGKPFEFYTGYTLDEAHEILQLLSERDYVKRPFWKLGGYLLRVNIISMDNDTIHFLGDRLVSIKLTLSVEGDIERAVSGTYIHGEVRISWRTLGWLLVLLLPSIGMWFLSLDLSMSQHVILPIICPSYMVVFTGLLFFECKRIQNKLYLDIRQAFGESQKKHSER